MADRVEVDIVVNTDSAKSSLSSLSRSIGLATIEINEVVQAAKAAASALVAFGKDSMDAFRAQDQSVSNLEAVLKSTGNVVGMTSKELQDLATSLQQTTLFGDEATIQAEALLLTFKQVGRDIFPDVVKVTQDVSTVMGSDLQGAMLMVGKALNDPMMGMTALRRVGIQLTDDQEKLVKSFMEVGNVAAAQGVIMDELKSQFGGAAEAMGARASSATIKLANAFGDLKESIGQMLTQALQPAIIALTSWASAVAAGQNAVNLVETAMKADIYKAQTADLEAYASALQKVIANTKAQIAADPSGMLGMGKLGDELKKYEQLLNNIGQLLMRRGDIGGSKGTTVTPPTKPTGPTFNPKDWEGFDITPGTIDVEQMWFNQIDTANLERFNEIGKEMADWMEPLDQATVELGDHTDAYAEAVRTLTEGMERAMGSSFVSSMSQMGADAYAAGMGINTLGAAISNMGLQILNMLPSLFLQAGLTEILKGNTGLGMALIAMAGTTAFASGYTNAAVKDAQSSTSKSMTPAPSGANASMSVNIENNSGVPAVATETTGPDGQKIVAVVIGQVNQSIARGTFDGAMGTRYGVKFRGTKR